jgi:O-antigen ligase
MFDIVYFRRSMPIDRIMIALGAALAVLAAVPYRAFDLDRFIIPKELALHALALALLLPALRRARRFEPGPADLALAAYLLLSFAGALFAPDHWLAARALALSLSGAAVFWGARACAAGGGRRAIVLSAAAAAVLAAAASLAQAYGLHSVLFSLNRVPGGTLGNRNFTAHLAAVCLPALALAALTARRTWGAAAGAAGLALLSAALVLTRSRTALLGLAAGVAVLAWGLWRSRAAWKSGDSIFRLKLLGAGAALGVLAALLLPNALEWKSRSPYLDTVTGVANYRTGSGHGRVEQYARSLRIAAAHPVLGAGPGNWGVVYPDYVDGFDRSIDYAAGRTMNPWPSSDWVAALSERGLPALAALLLLFIFLFAGAWRAAARAAAPGDALEGYALAATVAAAAVTGCFDAFLLLPAPAVLFWSLAGALAPAAQPLLAVEITPRLRRGLVITAALVWSAAMLRSSCQIAAMALYSGARGTAQLERAALLDPGNARIISRLESRRHRRQLAPAVAPEIAPAPDISYDAPEQAEPDTDPGPDAVQASTAAAVTP